MLSLLIDASFVVAYENPVPAGISTNMTLAIYKNEFGFNVSVMFSGALSKWFWFRWVSKEVITYARFATKRKESMESVKTNVGGGSHVTMA
ncbi:hypothetical protein L1987_57093 [Smallanthus sonchifolius]|uniref:Uncharacterized protein n=1 Tax=Smallanthus sonchifolius TaxID=185202 RepID=A0ACB9DC31_9ASTR|nr:hypothetical protein L1987_57093 [Smallanthus sonchifolius]